MADTNTYDLFQKVEKWTTKEKFNALDPRTIETGTEYNLTGAIDETDLSSDLLAKINGKLTKPTNPSAESAVTLLADGTVGTKLLSEIGGGKVYIHRVSLKSGLFKDYLYYITVPSSDATPITKETANRLLYGYLEVIDDQGNYQASTVQNVTAYESSNELSIDGTVPLMGIAAAIESDTVSER